MFRNFFFNFLCHFLINMITTLQFDDSYARCINPIQGKGPGGWPFFCSHFHKNCLIDLKPFSKILFGSCGHYIKRTGLYKRSMADSVISK